jgi:hypothetical protein
MNKLLRTKKVYNFRSLGKAPIFMRISLILLFLYVFQIKAEDTYLNLVTNKSESSQMILSTDYNQVENSETSTLNQKQEKTINGTVVDSDGEPIIGANIIIKGTNTGTVTDYDGNFSLNIADNAVSGTGSSCTR